jgi:D-sedoheptulose 7-phosphate isomerase
MDNQLMQHVEILIKRYPILNNIKKEIIDGYLLLESCYENGGKLLVAGNGGSAADSEHIVGELMKEFSLPRNINQEFSNNLKKIDPEMGAILSENLQGALPAIALDGHYSLNTAFANDCNPLMCFAQQVYGYGKAGDVFLGISTSGNSKNILFAATVAKAKNIKVLGLSGNKDSKLAELSDLCVKVPEEETFKIQELHLPIYHCWCMMLETRFFGNNNKL